MALMRGRDLLAVPVFVAACVPWSHPVMIGTKPVGVRPGAADSESPSTARGFGPVAATSPHGGGLRTRIPASKCESSAPGVPAAISGVLVDAAGYPVSGARLRVRVVESGPVLRDFASGAGGQFLISPATKPLFLQVSAVGLPQISFVAEPGVKCTVAMLGDGAYDDPILPGLADSDGATARLWGSYTSGFEDSSFHPCGRRASWWFARNSGIPESVREARRSAKCHEDIMSSCTIYLDVTAEITGLGAYGHEGAYARQMQVIQIHAASALPPPQCR
jgi:hypothetical protein